MCERIPANALQFWYYLAMKMKEASSNADPDDILRVEETAEKDVLELFHRFPLSLRQAWARRIIDKPTDEQMRILLEGLRMRNKAKVPRFTSPKLRVSEIMPPQILGVLRDPEPGRFVIEVNEGNFGVLYVCREQPITGHKVIYKVLKENPGQDLENYAPNDLQSEASFLAEAHALSLEHADVRVGIPTPYFFVSHAGGDGIKPIDILAMEYLEDAFSAEDIMDPKRYLSSRSS